MNEKCPFCDAEIGDQLCENPPCEEAAILEERREEASDQRLMEQAHAERINASMRPTYPEDHEDHGC